MSGLDELRISIQDLDRRILTLIGQRMDCAALVGRLKKKEGVPLRDWQVERAVLDQADRVADGIGLSGKLARSVMQVLIAASRVEQERLTYSQYTGSAESILVIGGLGKMGRWFVKFFADQGHRIRVYDVAATAGELGWAQSLAEVLPATTFAVIATPLDTVPAVIAELIAASYRGTVFDIASLKGPLKPAIATAREAGLSLASVHPMFGPGARTLSDQVICICDCGNEDATRRVRAFFGDTAATLVDLSLDEHDRIVSHVLGLSHLLNVLFVRVLMNADDSFDVLNRVGSTTFHSQITTSATVVEDNPELYYLIQRLNPFTPRLYTTLTRELGAVTAAVLDGDQAAFVELMNAAKEWLADKAANPHGPSST